jgi:hypothetical protein
VNRAEVREVAELYFQRFSAELQKGMAELRADLDTRTAKLRADLANQRAELIKWMFLFWAGTVLPLAGLAVALVKL